MAHSDSLNALMENQKKHSKTLNEYIDSLKTFKQIKMKVERTSVQSFLGRTKKSEGEMSLAKDGRFWWQIQKPITTLLVFDGSLAWNEEKLPEDLGGGFKITKTKSFKSSPAYRVLQVLMGKGDIWKMFTPLKTSEKDDLVELQLTPKDKSWNISLLTLRFKASGKQLHSITYIDELENETSLAFSSMEFLEEIDKNLFSYSPPKGAQITEL